jgi:hypothetical protein
MQCQRIFGLLFFGFTISFFSAYTSNAQYHGFFSSGVESKKTLETFSNWDWSKCQKIAIITEHRGDSFFGNDKSFNTDIKRCCIDTIKKDTQIVEITTIILTATSKLTIECIGNNHMHSTHFLKYDSSAIQLRKIISEQNRNFIQYDSSCGRMLLARYNVWSYNHEKKCLKLSEKWIVDTCFVDIRYPNGSPQLEGQYYGQSDPKTCQYKKMGTWRCFNPDGTLQREENHSPFVRLRPHKRE